MLKLIMTSYQESLEMLDGKAFPIRQRRSSSLSSIGGFAFSRQTETETREIGQAAEVFQSTLQALDKKLKQRYKRDITSTGLLSLEHMELIAELSGCPPPVHESDCQYSHFSKYRSINGMCNNRYNHHWGAANIPLIRWLPPQYEDGVRQPKGWNKGRLYNGFELPMAHDNVSSPQNCIPFNRSLPACFKVFLPDISQALQQQQINAITSFIDASVVYGSSQKMNNFLRDLDGFNGKLRVNKHFEDKHGRPYLPFEESLESACLHSEKKSACFRAGDSRVNEGLPLTSLHTLWVRQHNQIVEKLKNLNGHWTAATVYEETRKIVGALHQIITMRDYLPKIIGEEFFEDYIGPYRGYDSTVDPSASNVFATAAFRFGHATISPIVKRLNESYQEHEHFPNLMLHETFFSPWRIIKEGGIDPILRGAIGTEAAALHSDKLLADELTERLVVLAIPQQMDLASLNLQRGRDHGLPGYNDWRELCEMERIKTLTDLKQVVSNASVAEKIFQLYKHPDNIDVWLGGLVESFLPGSRTGPVFACLIAKQMKALRDGDRFWWEADGIFTQQQRDELLKVSLSKIICDNTNITEVPPDAFVFEKYPSSYVLCNTLPEINLEAWRDEKK
ncbi:thyroid peroxidase isoform X2 [Stigmatopora argus]